MIEPRAAFRHGQHPDLLHPEMFDVSPYFPGFPINLELALEAGLIEAGADDRHRAAVDFEQEIGCRPVRKRQPEQAGIYYERHTHAFMRARRLAAKAQDRIIDTDPQMTVYVEHLLRSTLSPEQIVGYMRRSSHERTLCHKTIYRWIHREWRTRRAYLRFKGRPRIPYGMCKRAWQPHKRHITEWPAIVEALKDLPVRTITCDNGIEFAQHKRIERLLGCRVYFTDTHSPQQRGSNENLNGLIREFFPKGSSMAHVTQYDATMVATVLNRRPRKRLGYDCPRNVFAELTGASFYLVR